MRIVKPLGTGKQAHIARISSGQMWIYDSLITMQKQQLQICFGR